MIVFVAYLGGMAIRMPMISLSRQNCSSNYVARAAVAAGLHAIVFAWPEKRQL